MGPGTKELAEVIAAIFIGAAAVTAFVLLTIYVVVPLLRGVGNGIGFTFAAIAWFFRHIFEFVGGVIGNLLRFVGSLLAMLVFIPLVPLNIVIGRWSAAGHFAERVKGECKIGSTCVYRALIHHPLKLVMLHGILEGLEQRVPEAMQHAPGADSPGRRIGQFDGYTIVGSLRAGGSGGKLYIAQPDDSKRRKIRNIPDRVVIKCFALTEGSSLPQIVRESRALECAKQLGHVFDHGMDQHRFFYVMPYHPGDHLGLVTRQLHGESGGDGLDSRRLKQLLSYATDLLATLSAYHKGGLWHKDVKPENVIVHDGRAHLVDLGLVTPLRSAMTLTTHGTEYFRDPEMVRQALRGVKVHQVDGAKFDIYAVGAVLYFMVENTFPAHGGLSRFVTSSPEAVRWIIRRAMTEYHQRYQSADQMLADLQYVALAPDAFAVKPADLPSMRGDSSTIFAAGDDGVEIRAASANPASQQAGGFEGFGVTAGIGEKGTFAQVGHFKIDEHGEPVLKKTSLVTRPRLTVTNWWTGAYKVDANGIQAAGSSTAEQEARSFREHAYAFRDEAARINRQAELGAMSPRKAAREQIKAARHRAREIRSRALSHRHRVIRHVGRGSGWAVAIGGVSLLVITGLVAAAFMVANVSSRMERSLGSVRVSPGRPVLLVLDAANPDDPRVISKLNQVIEQRQRQGYEIVIDENPHSNELNNLLEQWRKNKNGPADEAIERLLEERNLYGLLHVQVNGDRRNAARRVSEEIVMSSRPGAEDRRHRRIDPVPPPPTSLAYLLINDHPAKADAQVAKAIEQAIRAYENKGWNIATNVDAEVALRKYLPAGPVDAKTQLPRMLHVELAEAKLGGVLKIDASPGEGPLHERITVTRIDANHDFELAEEESGSSSMATELDADAQQALAGAAR